MQHCNHHSYIALFRQLHYRPNKDFLSARMIIIVRPLLLDSFDADDNASRRLRNIRYAGVMELVDVKDSKSFARKGVPVRVRPPVPLSRLLYNLTKPVERYRYGLFFLPYSAITNYCMISVFD